MLWRRECPENWTPYASRYDRITTDFTAQICHRSSVFVLYVPPKSEDSVRANVRAEVDGEVMARELHKLTNLQITKTTKPGLLSDGGGLYLRISGAETVSRRWVFLFRRPSDGKRCEIGLGGLNAVPLAKARKKASGLRTQVADGIDPLAIKQAERRIPTFGELADDLIRQLEPTWRNDKHKAQWTMTMREYAKPLRSKPVDAIETSDVLNVLQPIWQTKPETAARVRGRIEKVLDSAKVKGFRRGENPAAWRGHLALVLPKRPALSRGHHQRMPIDDVPEFMAKLREREGIACRCLEFASLTAARSGEALGALWAEIDLDAKVWTLPPHRMKPGREHRVPLSARSIEILKEMAQLRDGDFVFPGMRRGKSLSNMALEMVLRRMRIDDATVHGFRSCFRDWTGNRTLYPRELAEHALSHTIGDKAEQAYRRDTAVERRRPLMEAWANFCRSHDAGVIVFPVLRSSQPSA